jgi:hypothetical protein
MFTCESEDWTLNKSERKETEAAEMRFLSLNLRLQTLNTTIRNPL